MTLSKNARLEASLEDCCPDIHKRQAKDFSMIISQEKKCTTWDGNVANIHDGFLIMQHSGVSYSTYISDHMYIAKPKCELLLIWAVFKNESPPWNICESIWIDHSIIINTIPNGLGCWILTAANVFYWEWCHFFIAKPVLKTSQVKHLLGSLLSLIHSRQTLCKEANDHVV